MKVPIFTGALGSTGRPDLDLPYDALNPRATVTDLVYTPLRTTFLDAAKARGITVTNTPDVLSNATAEIAMLLLLGAARRAHEGARMLRTDTWADWSATGQLGIEVTGIKDVTPVPHNGCRAKKRKGR